MMLCILAVCLLALLIIHETSLNTLTRENLEKTQISLERNCATLADAMYATHAIPDAIETTKHYRLISHIRSGTLETKYYPKLSFIRDDLLNQGYLLGKNDAYLIYLSGTNSLCTNRRSVPKAEDYFLNNTIFHETDPDTILTLLREKGTLKLLPMQEIKLDQIAQPTRCMALVIHPSDSRIAVMTFYSEATILEALGISHLPDGTYLEIRSNEGQVVMQYPQPITEDIQHSSYMITGTLSHLGANVTLWIPTSHFNTVLQPVRQTGLITIFSASLAVLFLAILFSKISVNPIRILIDRHSKDELQYSANEIKHLDHILLSAQENAEQIQQQLTKQILARAMSGAVLSEFDEQHLTQSVPPLWSCYRIAILHTTQSTNARLGKHLQQQMDMAEWALISDKETGLIFQGDDAHVDSLTKAIAQLNQELHDSLIHCGVSAAASEPGSISKAVRQARAALPQDAGVKLFPGDQITLHAISWLQHERLYQSIFNNNEPDASGLLRSIAAHTTQNNAREVFYNLCFVIRSAAEEIDVSLPDHSELNYDANLLPKENIQRLQSVLHALFVRIREKNEAHLTDTLVEIMDYMLKNLSDGDLCAASVGDHFGLSEQRIYRMIRSQTDMSFNEYLTALRMKHAASLLYTTNLSISAVEKKCGYRTASTFYRQFREHYGVSPSQYRMDCGKTDKESAKPEANV